jgi:hypothetical protein
MVNFKDEILDVSDKEEIIGIVLGKRDWPIEDETPDDKIGVVLSWDVALPLLDYKHNPGYGGVECHKITAWTATRVLFVSQYDGSTIVDSVPRHPVNHEPQMPGG